MNPSEKRILVIINPISGTHSKEGLEDRVTSRLHAAGFAVDCIRTSHSGHGFELARKAADDRYYAVVAAGGDGTVNEVASALRETETILGILPYGSGNGLARHLLTSIDIDHALDIIAKDKPVRSDYGLANGIPFFCTFGLGFDANVSREFANMHQRGISSYLKSAISQFFLYSPIKYKISATNGAGVHSIIVKAFLVAVCNASQYGNNAFIAPGASVCDGLLDLVIIHNGNAIKRAIAGAELFTGRIDHNLLIETIRFKKARISHLPGPGHIDGDPRMMPETINISCNEGKLLIFSDPDKIKFHPYLTPLKSLRGDSSFLIRENAKYVMKNIKTLFDKK